MGLASPLEFPVFYSLSQKARFDCFVSTKLINRKYSQNFETSNSTNRKAPKPSRPRKSLLSLPVCYSSFECFKLANNRKSLETLEIC